MVARVARRVAKRLGGAREVAIEQWRRAFLEGAVGSAHAALERANADAFVGPRHASVRMGRTDGDAGAPNAADAQAAIGEPGQVEFERVRCCRHCDCACRVHQASNAVQSLRYARRVFSVCASLT